MAYKMRYSMSKPLCVFGIMDNHAGREIAREMMEWLQQAYDVTPVVHDGSKFELPALLAAQKLSRETQRPVLYLHTRGAVNTYVYTVPTRRMWREEFGTQGAKYFAIADTITPRVVCPFVDYDRETRYNGFVANTAAWDMLELKETTDRFDYERLWIDKPECEVLGLLINRSDRAIKDIRAYLLRNYS